MNTHASTTITKPKMNSHASTTTTKPKYLTRRETAERWRSSIETVKRRQRAGLLHPVYLSRRKILYSLAEVEAREANGATE